MFITESVCEENSESYKVGKVTSENMVVTCTFSSFSSSVARRIKCTSNHVLAYNVVKFSPT